ncbi:MAG: hypothetical protein LBM06_08730 [Prevotellaceae bacterium]|jgi:hypothetical protein|nr:hypothetical protein [Prevotellaceae bacterium]
MKTYQAHQYDYDKLYHQEQIASRVWWLLMAGVLCCLLFISCVKEQLQERPWYGYRLRVAYEWEAGIQQPAGGILLRLFPKSNGEPLSYETASTGYEGSDFTAGFFRLLAVNPHPKGVRLVNTFDYERASAEALTLDGIPAVEVRGTRQEAGDLLIQPAEQVYCAWDDALLIDSDPHNEEDVQTVSYQMSDFSRPVILHITNHTQRTAENISFRLRGLALSRRLAGGGANINEGTGSMDFGTSFAGDEATVTIPCLGIYNPDPTHQGVNRYRNEMHIVVNFADGGKMGNVVDITDQISQNMGDFDVSIRLELGIDLQQHTDGSIQAKVTVSHWDEYEQQVILL